MSLKKRIKIIKWIEKRMITQNQEYDNGKSMKMIVFPFRWWDELKENCMKK